jgi:signal peptidase I
MFESRLVRFFSSIYAVLLYTYPREFRLEYGSDMQQLFRDRCRDLSHTGNRARLFAQLFNFAIHSSADWMTTTVRERFASTRQMVAAARKPAPRGFIAEWAVTIVIYLFATTTLVQAYVIPTGSMEGNLRVGDHMLVDKVAYAKPGSISRHLMPYRDIQRGDIVAFLYPEDTSQTYVKRVIGLPGDRIRMDDKQVVRNGRRLIEPYTQHITSFIDLYRDDFPAAPGAQTTPRGREMLERHVSNGEVVVPPDTLFVMGDNRDNSADSRYWGFVPRDYVAGKPLLVYWSYDAATSEFETWNVAHLLDVAEHFFTKTRWERTLLIPRSQQAIEGIQDNQARSSAK